MALCFPHILEDHPSQLATSLVAYPTLKRDPLLMDLTTPLAWCLDCWSGRGRDVGRSFAIGYILEDHLSEITCTVVVCFSAFLLAEATRLRVSQFLC